MSANDIPFKSPPPFAWDEWYESVGGRTIDIKEADAILDRIVHDAHRIEMKGESLRKKRQPKNEEEIDLDNLKN